MQAGALLRQFACRDPVHMPVALVAAHPDDETIGAGAAISLCSALVLIHVTDGAPASLHDAHAAGFGTAAEYAAARRHELHRALQQAGCAPRLVELGARDQEASLEMAPLTRRLAQHLQQARVQAVITHPYEGGHPDHDATAFIVHKSVALLASPPPVIVEMTSYHAAPEGGMRVGQFLTDEPSGILVALSPEEQARKRAMLDCFATQHATLAPFGVEAEAFRPAPSYDFTQPPHSGLLHYERYDWGMTGARWRALAAEACADLGAACPAGA